MTCISLSQPDGCHALLVAEEATSSFGEILVDLDPPLSSQASGRLRYSSTSCLTTEPSTIGRVTFIHQRALLFLNKKIYNYYFCNVEKICILDTRMVERNV